MKELLAQQASLQSIRERKMPSPKTAQKTQNKDMQIDTPLQSKTTNTTKPVAESPSPPKPLVTPQTTTATSTSEGTKRESVKDEPPAKRQKVQSVSKIPFVSD